MGTPNDKIQPLKKIRVGSVSATIWSNTGKKKDGAEYEYKSVSIDRNYTDENKEWKKSNSYRANDLPKVILAAQKAFEFISSKDE